ncbi:MAG: hypothetical protein U0798_00955 [Gemmataceae bacterium]
MWIRALIATLAFGILSEAVFRNILFLNTNHFIGFLFVVIAASIFSKKMGKMALGTLAIFLVIFGTYLFFDSAFIRSIFESIGLYNDYTFGVILLFILSVNSTFLYLIAKYRIWEMTGSLIIFIIILCLFFYDLEGRSQAGGLLYGLIVTVALFMGIAIGALVRYLMTRSSRINNEDEQLAIFRFQLGIAPPSD